jgi:hypothetical protein
MVRPLLMLALIAAANGSAKPGVTTPSGAAAAAADSARVELVRVPGKLLIGQRLRLEARVVDANGTVHEHARIAWRATASSYVSLAADGRITGVRPGHVGIIAVSGDLKAERTIEVLRNRVGSFTLAPAYSTTRVGDTVHVALDVNDTSDQPITGVLAEWQLSPEGATIDDAGAFVPKMAGLYTILATIGDRKAVATVRVAPQER